MGGVKLPCELVVVPEHLGEFSRGNYQNSVEENVYGVPNQQKQGLLLPDVSLPTLECSSLNVFGSVFPTHTEFICRQGLRTKSVRNIKDCKAH